MKKQPIPKILYKSIFPAPGPKDPVTFDQFVSEVLDLEIRAEIAEWYNCHTNEELEEVYPGWDYADRTVRMRLSRYKGHSKLFKAFDKLGLSAHEINSVVTWHGTRSELEDWEAESGSVRGRDPSVSDDDDDEDYHYGEVMDSNEEEDDDDDDEEEEEEEENNRDAGVVAAIGDLATQADVDNTDHHALPGFPVNYGNRVPMMRNGFH
ncbi:hypothetical protein L873DRAFT_1360038 [Choiromyces venosus 120613-1]|uniref:Uncharacterized protein n=1 Tax=Choiromyces venosus 120613-1 TaxID=1336337 RepID=A0A3N4K2G4_9PEZI|nr:hypothetical protein L873DRAFT_1360038 [Choiromyces venosus 120613-1]